MRHPIIMSLLFCQQLAFADVFTCLAPTGETIYSDSACAKGAKIEKVSPSESGSDPVAAQMELERQKAYLNQRAAENARANPGGRGVAILPDYVSPPRETSVERQLSPASSSTSATPPNVR